ncbi:hypothetical protein PBCVIL3A_207R [Paramecium bursaria Chlorella virus IL3A]|uniref:DUF5853 domain-containing protein n=1 Tax=Paramecium bursaria Chlorella virus IL3A TaxID=46019 RepID=M1I5P6_PBCVI|nr:hypothetical protein PBCVIL3A_207R [Paramecium bursaria Chlorella virus IL3A]
MSSSPLTSSSPSPSPSPSPGVNKSNYKKLVNIRQGGAEGGQHVEVYIPDTRRKRSPEAEARALARAQIKEQYKAAALAEELKLTKKQRNKLVDNLAKVGKTPSVVIPTEEPSVLSGTPKTYVSSEKSGEKAGTVFGNLGTSPSVGNTTPISTTLGGSYDPLINYSGPIGPLPKQSASGSAGLFKNRPFDQQINYSQPIGPVQGPGLGMSFNRNRNYSVPIGPLPRQNMSGSAGLFGQRPFDQQTNYSAPIGPAQGPGLGMSFNRNRNYSRPIGPNPRENMSGSAGMFRNRPFDQQTNYSQPIGPAQGPGLGMSYDQNRNYPQPIGPNPRENASGSAGMFRNRPLNRKINYSQPIGPEPEIMDEPIGASPGRRTSEMVQNYSPSEEMVSTPTTSSGGQRVWERVFNLKYKPGMNIIYVNKVYKQYRKKYSKDQKKLRILNKGLADAKTDPRLAIRGPLNLKPEQLLPGKTLAEVENLYKKKRAKAQAAGKTQFVEALDKAISLRRQQFGAKSAVSTPQTSQVSKKTSTPTTSAEKNADMLLPGKTEDAVKRIYANRKTKALKKGDKTMAARLNRALPLRLKKIKTQSASVSKIPVEKLIPGDNLQQVEEVYKQRRAAAQAKGRVALVQALDKAIITRRKQLGGSPGGSPGKSPSPSRSAIRTPTGKTPSPTDVERRAEQLLPGKTEQAVRKIHASRKAAAVKRKDMKLAAELDKLLPIRLRRIKTQGANVLKIPADKLIPGDNLQQVEEVYKQRRAAAKAKGRDALVKALDRAIIEKRKRLGGSAQRSQSAGKQSSSSARVKVPITALIPGNTLEEIDAAYKSRLAVAKKEGKMELARELTRAYKIRRRQLGSSAKSGAIVPAKSGAIVPAKSGKKFKSMKNVPPEVLIPGKTPQQVESEYKKRRSMAVSKGRTELVKQLNSVIPIRRKQTAGKSSQRTPSGSPIKSPKKSALPNDWRKVFGPVDMANPNPRAVSEKYQAIRKQAADEDVGKLNALFKKAIVDIKTIKRKKQEETAKKSAEIQKEIQKKTSEEIKKKKDEEEKIQKEIRKTRQKLSKATTGIQKASANVQKFSKEVEIAARRRDQAKVTKFTRAAERRRQNMQRAQGAREKFSSNLRQLENKLSKVKMTPVASPQGQILALEAPPPKMRKVAPTPVSRQGATPVSKMIQSSKQMISPVRSPIKQRQSRQLEDSARKNDTMQKKIKQDEMKRIQKERAQKERAQKERAQKERAQKDRKLREETARKQRMMRSPVSSMKVRRMRRR